MVRVVGVDPGTRSFDICGLEDGRVYYESVIDTPKVAENPDLLIEEIEKAFPLDLIAGPSGYGVKPTYLRDVLPEKVEEWYLTHILLTKKEDLEEALKRGSIGIMVYYAMTKSAIEMRKRNWMVYYIPGVIHLPTVPRYRKFNKIDMGTADKMAIGALGVYDQSRCYDIEYNEVSFILIEMGFGYNAVLGVENGRIVDGVGGTSGGMGFLTIGSIDAELVQLVGKWEREDVFYGGASTVSGRSFPEELVECIDTDENCRDAWNALMESLLKNVYSMKASIRSPKEILISGRLTKIKRIEEELVTKLSDIASVRKIRSLENAEKVKEAAQGYAIVADGVTGGYFKDLIKWMMIDKAYGLSIDHIYHPKKETIKKYFTEY